MNADLRLIPPLRSTVMSCPKIGWVKLPSSEEIFMTFASHTQPWSGLIPDPKSPMNRVRNREVRVLEFAVVFPFTLPCPGRVEQWNQQIFTYPNPPISDSANEWCIFQQDKSILHHLHIAPKRFVLGCVILHPWPEATRTWNHATKDKQMLSFADLRSISLNSDIGYCCSRATRGSGKSRAPASAPKTASGWLSAMINRGRDPLRTVTVRVDNEGHSCVYQLVSPSSALKGG